VRQAISSLATGDVDAGIARLAADLASGEWTRKYAAVSALDELDMGYRLVTVGAAEPAMAVDEHLGR
jgi:hypothetical protein